MMDVPLDPESGSAPGASPSPERLVAAVRTVMETRTDQETDQEQKRGPRAEAVKSPPDPDDEETGESYERTTIGPEALVDWADETVDAFREAGGGGWGRYDDPHTQDRGSVGAAAGDDLAEVPKRLSAPPDSEDGGEDKTADGDIDEETAWPRTSNDPSEDLALAFRQAFFRRRVRHRPLGRAGAADKSYRTTAFPPRPASSFLWVTGTPKEDAMSVGVRRLTGPQARRAGAFLLRGDGEAAARLLGRIRRHADPRVFLKPVFWRRGADRTSPLADHVDGTWMPQADRQALRGLRERAATINRRIRDVMAEGTTTGANPQRRLLRFVATRTDEFAPRRVNGDLVYPKLTPLLGGQREEGAPWGVGAEAPGESSGGQG